MPGPDPRNDRLPRHGRLIQLAHLPHLDVNVECQCLTPSPTEAELFAVLVASKAIAQYRGTPWHAPLQRALQKMSAQLDGRERLHLQDLDAATDIRLSGPDDLDPKVFDAVARAMHQRRTLEFEYRKHAVRSHETRRVNPYQLACVNNRWYVIGQDLNRKALRVFVVARIAAPRLQSSTFVRPQDFSCEKYLSRSFGIFRGHDDFEVVIDLDPWAADVLRGRRWHSSQRIHELLGRVDARDLSVGQPRRNRAVGVELGWPRHGGAPQTTRRQGGRGGENPDCPLR